MSSQAEDYWWIGLVSIALFATSCVGPVSEDYIPGFGAENRVDGIEALLMGWILLLVGCPAWCANPLMAIAYGLQWFGKRTQALIAASVIVPCCLSIIVFCYPPTSLFSATDPRQSGTTLRFGAWMWITSIQCAWLHIFAVYRCSSGPREETAAQFELPL